MLVIGIYARKSVYRDTSESVATQIKLCKEYSRIMFRSQELDFIVYGKDEGFTGFNMNRPSFKEMMKDVESGVLNVVMVYRLDRISGMFPNSHKSSTGSRKTRYPLSRLRSPLTLLPP